MRQLSTFCVTLSLAVGLTMAQSMEKAVAKLGEEGAKAYMQPVVTAFGANMNAGWFTKTPRPVKYAFHMSAGLAASGAMFTSAKTVNVETRMLLDTAIGGAIIAGSSATPAQRDSLKRRLAETPQTVVLQGPAITGPEADRMSVIWGGRMVATGLPGDSVYLPADTVVIANLNGLLDGLEALTLFAPQIHIGTLYGTNLTLRWLPDYESRGDIGPIDYFGVGIHHNPAVWFQGRKLPVDFTLGGAYQTLEGTFFKATAWSAGLHVSKTLGWRFASASPYLGGQYEQSSFDVEYDLVALKNVQRIKTTIEGENKYRVNAGVNLRLLAINVNLDASYAQSPSAAFGVMIGL